MRCVHCRRELDQETKDHVFPKSWYPSTTPNDVQRWTVHSCAKCNGELGKAERDLFVRLAMCIDPRKAEAAGLSAKVIRSLGVGAEGLTLRETLHRRALKMRILTSMFRWQQGIETFPGLGPHPGFSDRDQMAIPISEELLRKVAEKFVRGSEYVLSNGRILTDTDAVGIYFVHERNVPDEIRAILQHDAAQQTRLGPGFRVTRFEAQDGSGAVLYKFEVWGALVIYASIIPPPSA